MIVKKIFIAAGIVLASFTMQAQHKCDSGARHGFIMSRIPELTPEQAAKIEPLEIAHLKKVQQLRNVMRELDAHLQTLETTDGTTLEAINKQIEMIGTNKTAMMKERASFRFQVRVLLTDKQKIAFDAMAEHEGRKHGFRNGGEHRRGQRGGERNEGQERDGMRPPFSPGGQMHK